MSVKTPITIATFKKVAPNLPPHMAVLMRGPTGVGKSHLAKQVADHHKIPFVDVRGSTMSEGDVGGYPDIESMKETGVMTFCMPSWFVRACNEPVVLMLDELNRSLPGVQQSFFQLVLDRELGNDKNGVPYRLHPETRVLAAVNFGSEYDVNEMDPALLRRFWVCDIEPSTEDWVTWARDNDIDSVIIDFINQNPAHLRVDPSTVEPGTVCPNPASWHRANDCLMHMDMAPSSVAGSEGPEGMYALLLGLVGTEAAIAFCSFVKEYERQVSAEDVLAGKVSKADIKSLPNSTLNGVTDKLGHHCKENDWTQKQCKNAADFAKALPGEMMVQVWNAITQSTNIKNIQKMHKLMGSDVVKAVQASRNLDR
ncbi:MAG: hypothetical protein CBC29_06040 [Methylococcaceae bacterium TMED69]|nr:MAG: hypothetical protein CBC29_06040 [Methylococcaceae bacterium TMED69]